MPTTYPVVAMKTKKGKTKNTMVIPAAAVAKQETVKQIAKTEAKKAISRANENKQVGWQVESNTQHNSAISSADCYPLVQQIGTGTTATRRQGDRITPKSLVVRGVLSWNADDCNTSQNIYARIIIASQKNIKTGSAVAGGGVDAARLLKPSLDSAPETQFAGATMDLNTPINKELFRVYMDKIVKLTVSVVTGGGREAMPLYSARWTKVFKKLPSSFTYDAGNGDWANNFAPFVAVGYAYSDGSSPDTTTTKLIHNVLSVLDYEDA